MEAKQYTISEAAKKLHVGSHVLRFWEEERHLNIPRNEMGHRVYSEKAGSRRLRLRNARERTHAGLFSRRRRIASFKRGRQNVGLRFGRF